MRVRGEGILCFQLKQGGGRVVPALEVTDGDGLIARGHCHRTIYVR